MFKYPIAISLSPNTEKEDVWEAIKTLFKPWVWKRGQAQELVKQWFRDYFKVNNVFLFNSGRSVLYTILKAFDIKKGDEVIIQSFTCVAVPNAILWVGAKPVYADIDQSLNINPELLERHITHKTRAIIVQHTFGVPAQIEKIKKITQKQNIILIEDCAHSLGATYQGKKIGSFGEAAFFSFGRDKVISSVFGGAAIINSELRTQNSEIKRIEEELNYPNYFWILQQLFHPIAFAFILPLYNIAIGKVILFLLLKLHLISKPVYNEEKKGEKPNIFPAKYPNALARLLLLQLKKLKKLNEKRRKVANYYFQKLENYKDITLPVKQTGAIYLRFNILYNKAHEIFKNAKKNKILLGSWYQCVIDPKGVIYTKVGYVKGLYPKAEMAAQTSINLPTYSRLTSSDLKEIVELFKFYEDKRS